ncbi:serine hydrolase [Patescibacteria group bacterium]|nr:serine hydrolase [Patescibacteria group bacterium]
MRKKIIVLMSAPLVFFGISFEVISHPVFSEKTKNIEIDRGAPKEPENGENAFFSRRNYVLPLEQILAPNRKAGKENILINAKSVLAVDDFSGQTLYEKDAEKKVKIASLIKLATAGAMLDFVKTENSNLIIKAGNYSLDNVVEISESAVRAEGDSGSLLVGEKIKAGELLKIMLIASSNDAARAIAEDITKKNNSKEQGIGYFVGLMNNFAKKEGLAGTHFINPDGIDERDNYSTAKDVVELSRSILKNYPEIFNITRIDKINIKSEDGKNDHFIKNTNKLLGSLPGIVGGKTGYTDEAGESLLLVVEDSTRQHRIVAVVIGANGRFLEMEKLINWVWDTYEWK